jgi:hypothetical protein
MLQVQLSSMNIQIAQLESQERQESEQRAERMKKEREDKIFSTFFEIVEDAKEEYRIKKYYRAILTATIALQKYKTLVGEIKSGDGKQRMSKFNDEIFDVVNKSLDDDCTAEIIGEVMDIANQAKLLNQDVATLGLAPYIADAKKSFNGIQPDSTPESYKKAISALDDLSSEFGQYEIAVSEPITAVKQINILLSPFNQPTVEYLKAHQKSLDKVKHAVLVGTGVDVSKITEELSEPIKQVYELKGLKEEVAMKKSAFQSQLETLTQGLYDSQTKGATRVFWIVAVVGFVIMMIVTGVSGKDENGKTSDVVGAIGSVYFIGMAVYWFMLRSKKNKVRQQIEAK